MKAFKKNLLVAAGLFIAISATAAVMKKRKFCLTMIAQQQLIFGTTEVAEITR